MSDQQISHTWLRDQNGFTGCQPVPIEASGIFAKASDTPDRPDMPQPKDPTPAPPPQETPQPSDPVAPPVTPENPDPTPAQPPATPDEMANRSRREQ